LEISIGQLEISILAKKSPAQIKIGVGSNTSTPVSSQVNSYTLKVEIHSVSLNGCLDMRFFSSYPVEQNGHMN